MANVNTPISQLPVVTAIDGAEVVPLDQGGTTKQATLNQVINGAIQTNFPGTIEYVVDANTAAITPGLKGYLEVPFDCTVALIDIYGNTTGSVSLDIWACTYDQFDGGVTHPVAADSILGGAYPSFTSGNKARVSYGNAISLPAGTILAFYINSVTSLSKLTISIKVARSIASATSTSTIITNISQPWIVNGSTIYYTSGPVGIGTSSPTSTLSVVGSLGVTGTSSISSTLTMGGDIIVAINSAVLTGQSTRYAFGIGNPTTQVSGLNFNQACAAIINWSNSANTGAYFSANSRGGAVGTHTIVNNGDDILDIRGHGSDGSGFQPGVWIRGVVDGAPGVNSMPSKLVFYTNSGTLPITARLFIDSTGVFGPVTNDGVPLGTGALSFSDLFLASGGLINWNNGNVTAAHSNRAINFTGATGATLYWVAAAGDGTGVAAQFSKNRNATNSQRYQFLDVGGLSGDADGGAFWRGFHLISPTITDPTGGANVFPTTSFFYEYNSLSAPSARNFVVDLGNVTATSAATFVLRIFSSDKLIVSSSAVAPGSSGGITLGTTAAPWGDTYIKSTGKIDWGNGNVTLTHSSGQLTNSGALSTARLYSHDSGTSDDTIYGGPLVSTRAAANTGQHINIIRAGTVVYSIGYDYNTSNFAIGAGQATDSNFTGANLALIIGGGNITPGANAGQSLGSTSKGFANLYLSSGAAINWNNGNMTVTQAAGSLTIAGGVLIGAASTTSNPTFRIPSGTAPSSPTSGDFWYDGANLKFRDGGTTRTITWV